MALGPLYRPFLEIARQANVDVDAILARLGLTEAQVLQPTTRLSPDVGRELGRALFAQVGDPLIGLRAAERFRLPDSDLLGYLIQHSPDLLFAIERIVRYARLIGDTADIGVERARDRVTISFGLLGGRRMLPEGMDGMLGVMHHIVRDLSGGRSRPLEVHLHRVRPRRPSAYRRFFGCRVVFGADRDALVYTRAALDVPLAGGDRRLVAILETRADEVISTLPRGPSTVDRVRAHIARHLEDGSREIDAIAADLRMSERTLRRHLRNAGANYRALLDEVRRERALALVEHGDEKVAAIAQKVGFSDATAFARAFRRWTGMAPHEYVRR